MTRPNILVILADDLGYGDVQCYHPEGKISTPHIDALAAEGMRFTDAHAASSVCTPSRYSMLTGEYCWRTSLQAGVLRAYDPPLIDEGTPTLAGILRDSGYHTACIGKWHLGLDWPHRRPPILEGLSTDVDVDYAQPIGGGPLDRGFDEWFGMDTPVIPPHAYIEGRHTVGIPDQPYPDDLFGLPGDTVAGWTPEQIMQDLTDRTVTVIEDAAETDQPFFVYFSMTAPHTPISPSEQWQGKSGIGPYGDFVMQLDHHVGEVMNALERTGQKENTLVIFTSDNGSPAMRSHDESPGSLAEQSGHDSAGPLRGMKGDVWEAGHRVPFIASLPGVIPEGTVNDRLTSLIDLIPTLASIADVDVPQGAAPDAIDFSPYLRGEEPTEPLRPWLIHHGFHGTYALRQDRWKLIPGKGSGGFSPDPYPARLDSSAGGISRDQLRVPPYQLYDLVADLAEQHNRYGEHPRLVGELECLLSAARFGLPIPQWNEENTRWETIV